MSGQTAANLRAYNEPDVAAHYAALQHLTACERFLFDNYIRSGMAVLDMGVGGGRTTPYLSQVASRYVGVDYAEAMIKACRSKFPGVEFLVADASDLSVFPDAAFDAIVMAFNGLDYVVPENKRMRCLRECSRVLRAGGVFIFSSHNPRSILIRPGWDRKRLEAFAQGLVGEQSGWLRPLMTVLTPIKAAHAYARAALASSLRILRRVPKAAFWRGEGYLFDSAHGGLMTHCCVPERVVAELGEFDFQLATRMGDDFPRTSPAFVTDWYYYVFLKPNRSGRGDLATSHS